jgi:hypothetical protein
MPRPHPTSTPFRLLAWSSSKPRRCRARDLFIASLFNATSKMPQKNSVGRAETPHMSAGLDTQSSDNSTSPTSRQAEPDAKRLMAPGGKNLDSSILSRFNHSPGSEEKTLEPYTRRNLLERCLRSLALRTHEEPKQLLPLSQPRSHNIEQSSCNLHIMASSLDDSRPKVGPF